MKFTLTIKSDNAAMVDYPDEEVVRILETVMRRIRQGTIEGKVQDSNGNTVGSYKLEVDDA